MRNSPVDFIVKEMAKVGCIIPKEIIQLARTKEKFMLFDFLDLVSINDCSFVTHEEINICVKRFINNEL